MASTTSISDLPVGSSGNNASPSNNITLETNDKIPPAVVPQVSQAPIQAPTPQNMPDPQKQLEMNKVVSGIQQASAVGSTLLPSRDIPQNTLPLVQDNQSSPTFVPMQQGPQDYINDVDPQQLIAMEQRNNSKRDAVDDFYNEIQSPLLIAVLYLIFQLPVTNKLFRKYMPPLFTTDGNQNTVGYVVISALFAAVFYSINLIMSKFNSVV